jgi:hypothetical protein
MNFGAPPLDLRAVVPYLARATELRRKEPIIAYYCQSTSYSLPALRPLPGSVKSLDPVVAVFPCSAKWHMVYLNSTGLYYATQVGITIKSTQKESKTFLVNLMTSLEGVRPLHTPHFKSGSADHSCLPHVVERRAQGC